MNRGEMWISAPVMKHYLTDIGTTYVYGLDPHLEVLSRIDLSLA
jgi:hypothetical protein